MMSVDRLQLVARDGESQISVNVYDVEKAILSYIEFQITLPTKLIPSNMIPSVVKYAGDYDIETAPDYYYVVKTMFNDHLLLNGNIRGITHNKKDATVVVFCRFRYNINPANVINTMLDLLSPESCVQWIALCTEHELIEYEWGRQG